MNASHASAPDAREVPGWIAKKQPDAVFAWVSTMQLDISKGDADVTLSADDLRRLMKFIDDNAIEEQL